MVIMVDLLIIIDWSCSWLDKILFSPWCSWNFFFFFLNEERIYMTYRYMSCNLSKQGITFVKVVHCAQKYCVLNWKTRNCWNNIKFKYQNCRKRQKGYPYVTKTWSPTLLASNGHLNKSGRIKLVLCTQIFSKSLSSKNTNLYHNFHLRGITLEP